MNGQRSPRGNRRRWWLAGGVVALAVASWCVRSAVSVGGAGVEGVGGTGGSSTTGAPAITVTRADAQATAQTAAMVAARNRDSGREAEAFRNAGWTMVVTPPPDARLVALDPALLDGREAELRQQLVSTTPSPGDVPHLLEIARRAHEAATRVAAVESLGRAGTPAAQTALLTLLDALPADDPARQAVAPLLRPPALDDPSAVQLAAALDAPTRTPAEKEQLAFTLALVGLRDGMRLPDGAASPSARALIDRMTALATGRAQTREGEP